MSELLAVLALASISLLAAGALLWRGSGERDRQTLVQQRLHAALRRFQPEGGDLPAAPETWRPSAFDNRLRRAGFLPSGRLYLLLALPGLALGLTAGFAFGAAAALGSLGLFYPALLAAFLQWRSERFRARVVAQLPDFVDNIVRILSVGCSLELAFRNASGECPEPLRGIFAQALLRTQAGTALEDALAQVAEAWEITELKFTAATFYLGMRFGGNANAILERIALGLRERQRSQKELLAMTAETRVSAWILGALPLVVGGLILFVNPGYLRGMWLDEFGKQLLLAAGVLQVLGVLLLTRMAKLS